jgi:hypothetical protein
MANFKRSDQVIALRALTRAVKAVYGKVDLAKVEQHARDFPGGVGQSPLTTAAKERDVIRAMQKAEAALALIDGTPSRNVR